MVILKNVMSNWLLKKLQGSEKDYPDPKYAFNSSVNWMRALKNICETSINERSVIEHYKDIQKNNNTEYSIKALGSIFSALNYLQTLNVLTTEYPQQGAINAHIAIISWYYCIYNSAKSIIAACNNSYQETHASTAKMFHGLVGQQKIVLYPFDLLLNGITDKTVETQISEYRNGSNTDNSLNSDYYPQVENNNVNCLLAYLKGTAEYTQCQVKEKLKRSKDFTWNDFRTKKARECRDKLFQNQKVNFLTQAFRYRGKANYRDCTYFAANVADSRITTFIQDLKSVAGSFFKMSAFYVHTRIETDAWLDFINDLEQACKSYFFQKSVN